MKMNKKIIPTIAIIPIALILGLMLGSTFNISTPAISTNNGVGYSGIGCIEVTRADGTKEPMQCSHNQLNLGGMNLTMDYLFQGSTLSPINAIAVSQLNTSQVATNQYLQGEWAGCGLQRAAGTQGVAGHTTQTAGNRTVFKAFTSSCDNMLVNGTALYNSTTNATGTMFAQANFTAATLQNNDIINVSWFVYVT